MTAAAVAAPHRWATDAGVGSLRAGGNAVDAALAAAICTTVVYPHNTAVGGDLIALVRTPDGEIRCVNGSGPAPRGRTLDDVLARHGDQMPITGIDTVTVPGAVAGWEAVHRSGARLPWQDHFSAALEAAGSGVPVARSLAGALGRHRQAVAADPGMSAVFAPGGSPLREGDTLRQPALAETLRELSRGGPEVLYGGPVGDALTTTLREQGSAMSLSDLSAFEAQVTQPLGQPFGDHTVWTSPQNTQGFLLLEVLGAVHALGRPMPDLLGADAAVLARLFAEASQDRRRLIGDPGFGAPDVGEVLEPAQLRAMALRAIDRSRTRSADEAGVPEAGGDTVAVVAADSEGYAACVIQSVFHSFGAGILDPLTGILLHNRGSFFSVDPRSPNCFAPGKRPGTTLMPVMVTRHDRDLALVCGTMGGKGQPQIHTQVLLRMFTGADPVEAVRAPRWIVGGLSVGQNEETVHVEADVPPQVVAALAAADIPHETLPPRSESTGHAQLIARDEHGTLSVASDERADGSGRLVR